MSVLEALQYSKMEAQVIQPRFLKPFPVWELSQFHDESAIVVEQSKAGQFSQLLTEKTKIQPTALINRYDGRPFEPIQLAKKIKEVIS
jgi:2-oxoglutarate ferredoxin oxidoreductase subunit alpha